LKPGQWVHGQTTQFTLYGPGVNASSQGDVFAHFELMMKTIYKRLAIKVENVSVVAESDFTGTALGTLPFITD
jgi:hypothetical protein